MDSLYTTVYVVVTPDCNWYGPYADEEQAQDARDRVTGRHGKTIAQRNGTDWVERRATRIVTARETMSGISIDWPSWPARNRGARGRD